MGQGDADGEGKRPEQRKISRKEKFVGIDKRRGGRKRGSYGKGKRSASDRPCLAEEYQTEKPKYRKKYRIAGREAEVRT